MSAIFLEPWELNGDEKKPWEKQGQEKDWNEKVAQVQKLFEGGQRPTYIFETRFIRFQGTNCFHPI